MSMSTKGVKRWHKKQRMAKMYRDFFDDPKNQADIQKHHFFWCIPFHPRLVRDTVLGSRRYP